jgi:hypothetical protein
MRKGPKRLKLSFETLRALQPVQLSGIAGATGNTYEIQTGCACTCSCGCTGTGTGTGTSTGGCGTGTTYEIVSGCATNC